MRLSLGYQVLIAVGLGLIAGIFFGPLSVVLRPVGDIYVMLLQMVALPYICFTLIHGLGSMTPEIAKKLFKSGWPFWISLWTMIFVIIYLLGLLIPKPLTAFVGSASHDRDSDLAKNFLSYLVPENPFYDLANNVVPSIAIFGLIVGIALMHLEKKEPLLSIVERANQIIEKILKWIALLSPVGIFAHIAIATGTVYFEDLFSLQFYVVSFILVSLFMVLWVLPTFLSNLTPLTYREVLKAFRTVCILPFATGLPTIALPFIALYMKKLGEKHAHGDPNFHATSQTVMPFCYSFGQIGNSMILFFILFLSFFFRHPFAGSEKALLTILTIPLSVGSSATSINAVSFLTQQLNFPDTSVDLFSETLAITLNFQVLLSIASVLTFIILALYSYYGLLQIKWKKLFLHLSLSFGVLGLLIFGGKKTLHFADKYQNLYMNLEIADVIEDPVPAKLFMEGQVAAHRENHLSEPLEKILKTGVLKVGYDPLNIPYAYWNGKHHLVGFDIAYAYQLARDLDCILEFIPLHLEEMSQELNQGTYDLAMSAIIMNETRITEMDFTHPYTEEDNVLVVPLRKRASFLNYKQVVRMPGLRIGARGGYKQVIDRHFPLAENVPSTDIDIDLIQGRIDAWVWSHIPAFVWCLSHPQYAVADYQGLIGKRYFSYPIKTGSVDWASFLDNWLTLKEQSGFKEKMRRYWIDGESPKERSPRWSLIRNVLHWVD